LLKQQGLEVEWFKQPPKGVIDELGVYSKNIISSYLQPPKTLYLNETLKNFPTRLKYELAVHIGHCVLHSKDGYQTVKAVGGSHGGRFNKEGEINTQSSVVNAKNILRAWRSFESSFFAGALLCPKVPFRQLLDRSGYEIDVHKQVGVSASVAMRRMTAVSSYSHWHYFDAYSPGKLKAVYRGNGIPLPWGNMRAIEDPCPHWAVFRKIGDETTKSSAQISILNVGGSPRIFCCESINVADMAGNNHVLTAGIDLNPALETQGKNATALAEQLKEVCVKNGGVASIPKSIKDELRTVSKILNINWIERGLESKAHLICSQSGDCPRNPSCYGKCKK